MMAPVGIYKDAAAISFVGDPSGYGIYIRLPAG
jgi:hypothetical protein